MMTRIDSDLDWCELERLALEHNAKLVYRAARCQHGKTSKQICRDCEGGYVTDTHVFAYLGLFARFNGKPLVSVSDDAFDVAYVPATEQHKFVDAALPPYLYCCTCGGRYNDEIPNAPKHVCPGGKDDDPQWCGWCGAELNANGSCDNDHSGEW